MSHQTAKNVFPNYTLKLITMSKKKKKKPVNLALNIWDSQMLYDTGQLSV